MTLVSDNESGEGSSSADDEASSGCDTASDDDDAEKKTEDKAAPLPPLPPPPAVPNLAKRVIRTQVGRCLRPKHKQEKLNARVKTATWRMEVVIGPLSGGSTGVRNRLDKGGRGLVRKMEVAIAIAKDLAREKGLADWKQIIHRFDGNFERLLSEQTAPSGA